MTVGVRDQEFQIRTVFGEDSIYCDTDPVEVGHRARVQQERPFVAEGKIHERRLVVEALVLPQDLGLVVVTIRLHLRIDVFPANRAAMYPGNIDCARWILQ